MPPRSGTPSKWAGLRPTTGTDENDTIEGTDGTDRINAGDGDDMIITLAGDDRVNGGEGVDTLVLRGNLADAEISKGRGNTTVIATAEGTYTIRNVELIQFDDVLYSLDGGVVNAPVETQPDTAGTDEDTAIAIDVLVNDIDPDGDAFSVTAIDAVSALGAALSLNAAGEVVYDPTGSAGLQALVDGDSVIDTFTYTVTDSFGNVSNETVTVTVTGSDDLVIVQLESGFFELDREPGESDALNGTFFTGDGAFEFDFMALNRNLIVPGYDGETPPGIAELPTVDLDGDGDLEWGLADDDWVRGPDTLRTTITRSDGESFALGDFRVVNQGGDDTGGFISFSAEGNTASLQDIDGALWSIFYADGTADFGLTQAAMLTFFNTVETTSLDLLIQNSDSNEYQIGEPTILLPQGNGLGIDDLAFL